MEKSKRWWLYILQLEGEKYYVGITSKTPEQRFNEHTKGIRAANWTRKYKPIKILQSKNLGYVSKEDAERYENKITAQLMGRKGLNNVRGGSMTETAEYTKRLWVLWLKSDWEIFSLAVLSFLLNIYLLLDKFFL